MIKNSKGFTLIEIVIVIAIAALILAAVLVFVPQAQASQRDQERRAAVGKVLSVANECASNNSGTGCSVATMNTTYMTNIKAPGGASYVVAAAAPACAVGSSPNSIQYTAANGKITASVCLEKTGALYTQST